MRTITRKYAVLSPRELKEQYPKRFEKAFDKHNALDFDWWDSTYEDFQQNTHMYVPAVCTYFRNYPPATWPTRAWPDELAQLVSAWEGVVTSNGTSPAILEFDLYPHDISLGDFRLHIQKFLELIKFSWPEPLALEATVHRFEDHKVFINLRDPLGDYYDEGDAVAEDFLHRVFGVPKSSINEGFSEDAKVLGEQIDQCFEAIKEAIQEFFKDVGREVLRVLEAEHDYLTSEEAFLERGDLEFEVFLGTVDEQETAT